MVKPTAESGNAIEKLLQERSQYQDWLARLAAAGSGAPDAVRQRVRADYESRLQAVMDELRTHSDTINGDLDRFRAAQADLERRESEEQERISEAEVRHAVGEFEESKWQEISTEANRGLSATRGELGEVRSEITRLAEVQSLISAAPAKVPEPEPEPPPPEEPEFEPVLDTIPLEESPVVPEPPATVSAAPRVVPRPAAPRADAPPGDELAFLQSVTGGEAAAARPRASGGHPAPAAAESVPAASAPVASAAATAMSAPATSAPAKPGTVPQAKTLKCGECGTLNRPTEWYCERCGAELAAL